MGDENVRKKKKKGVWELRKWEKTRKENKRKLWTNPFNGGRGSEKYEGKEKKKKKMMKKNLFHGFLLSFWSLSLSLSLLCLIPLLGFSYIYFSFQWNIKLDTSMLFSSTQLANIVKYLLAVIYICWMKNFGLITNCHLIHQING